MAVLGERYRSYEFDSTDTFYLRNDTIRRLETYTGAGTYVDHWEFVSVIKYTVPKPTPETAREAVVVNPDGTGHTTAHLPTRDDSYPHVPTLPTPTATSPDLVYLEHDYSEGVREDATLRIGTDGNLAGYSDSRLGRTIGSINRPVPWCGFG